MSDPWKTDMTPAVSYACHKGPSVGPVGEKVEGEARSLGRHGSAPRFYWEQCYEMGPDEVHWALRDTESTRDGKVTCSYMVLLANYPKAIDGKPVGEQPMPALIVELLNAHFAKPNIPR